MQIFAQLICCLAFEGHGHICRKNGRRTLEVPLDGSHFCILLGARPGKRNMFLHKQHVNKHMQVTMMIKSIPMRLKWSMKDAHLMRVDCQLLRCFGMLQDPRQCHFETQFAGHGVKLKDVKVGFPLPGQYHFRFKMKWESGT